MKPRTIVAISTMALAFAWPRSGLCQELTIDNFTTGPYRSSLRFGDNATDTRKLQIGTMLGGMRYINFVLGTPSSSNNPYNQAGELSILRVGRLVLSAGFKVFPRIEVFYGFDGTALVPLNRDLSAYDHFRVHFEGLNDGLNFNMQVIGGNNPIVAQSGVNLLRSGQAFDVDLPFNSFVPSSGPLPNFSDIDFIDLIIQPGNDLGADNLAITSIKAVRKNP